MSSMGFSSRQPEAEASVGAIRALVDREDYEQALQAVEPAERLYLHNRDLLFLHACALLGVGEAAAALRLSLSIVNAEPTNALYWDVLCCSLRMLGEDALAMQVNEVACRRAQLTLRLARFRADTLFEAHQYRLALAAYEPVLQVPRGQAERIAIRPCREAGAAPAVV